MFVGEGWRGDRAQVWRSVPPPPVVPTTLWAPDGPQRPASDEDDRAPQLTFHQVRPARTTEDAVCGLAAWRYLVSHATPGATLARWLQHRPARPAEELEVPAAAPLWANVLLDSIQARDRLIAHLQARQVADLAELSGSYSGLREFLPTEVALALGVSEGTASARLAEAEDLVNRLPQTFIALDQGRISAPKAGAIRVGTQDVDPGAVRRVERDVLPEAPVCTMPQVRDMVARAVIRHDPKGADDRHETAKARRRVSKRSEPDGMGTLSVYSTMQDIASIHTCLTAIGDAGRTRNDDRSADNRRVDALVDLCAEVLDTGTWRNQSLPTNQRQRPHVQVTVPLTALLDQEASGEVADLAGYGPITPAQARQAAADATLRRLVCDPLTGTLLDYGRTTYTPPAPLADHVMARDLTCVLPGCRQPAHRCELDHIDPFRPGQPVGGPTSDINLGIECIHHHRAKDGGEFTLTRTPDGTNGQPRWGAHTPARALTVGAATRTTTGPQGGARAIRYFHGPNGSRPTAVLMSQTVEVARGSNHGNLEPPQRLLPAGC